ncbi:hypothetical protein TCAL_08037 [Tigriopus californicus]|uniref:Autophagy-related protein 13 n=2 Tax=Tigriopus californicus TaxID=6832 RepID=A0A553NNF8_TIGCA|nr:hypothetical protein TCAL_08037 [Tigriopus californicus]|eukprot:TCALIF_08037-PA protein Name:"Similar to Atg13 Autophagy-related protein 13 homolog (Drosophila melanogaster)" AED:0.07 eAED:0.31 QI:0/0/0/1/1/1/2/0/444
MILENWTLAMEDGPDLKCANNVIYNKMSVMLKSLLCVTRSVPAYRLSRKQGPESFVICYKLFVGEPSSNVLGEGYQSCPVGQVMTGLGTLTLKVDYRTSMTISPSHPTNTSSETSSNLSSHMMMKSDHFDSDLHHVGSNPNMNNNHANANANNHVANKARRCDFFGARVSGDEFETQVTSDESGEAMRIFSASPQERPSFLTDNFDNHAVKFGAFASHNQGTPPPSEEKKSADLDNLMDLFTVEEDRETGGPTTPTEVEKKLSNLELQNHRESAQSREDLRRTQSDSEFQAREVTPMRPRAGSSPKSGPQLVSGAFSQRMKSNEDFELLDLKTPFSAKMGDPSGDLGVFFREPPLKTIKEVVDSSPVCSQSRDPPKPIDLDMQGARKRDPQPECDNEIDEEESSELGYLTSHLSQQLHTYESRLAEYDDMLKNLETSESESEAV